ncbi:MAG: hypothetical protein U0175_36780 [Caldilineaceae bacterium]
MESAKQILLLDDNYESMKPLKDALEAVFGYSVTLTAAATLLPRLAKDHFDLLIVDQMIAPLSLDDQKQEVQNIHYEGVHWHHTGPEFVRRLRQGLYCAPDGGPDQTGTQPDVPVILLSAVADSSMSQQTQQSLQISAYMEKPFDLEALHDIIEAIFS